MDTQKLKEKRADLCNAAKAFLTENINSDGKISAENVAKYEAMESEIVELGKTIELYQRASVMDFELSKPTDTPLYSQPTVKFGRASNEYKQAALTAFRTQFRNISNYLNEGTDSAGGYLVPAEWDSRLIDTLTEENIMRKLGTTIQTSGEHKINLASVKPAAAWLDEGAALQFGDATFGQISLTAHKLQIGIIVTNELLHDNKFNLENYILDTFSTKMAEAEEDAFLNGAASDTSKPTGLFETASANSDSVVTTAGTSLAADDIFNLVYKLKRPYRRNAAFIMNDATLRDLRKLKDSTQQYLWQRDYQAGEPDRLIGYPVYTSPFAPVAAAGKPFIAFGDFSYYNIADREARSFNILRELYAGNDKTGFTMLERVDGLLVQPEAVRVLKMK